MLLPSDSNLFAMNHAQLLRNSFRRWLGRELLSAGQALDLAPQQVAGVSAEQAAELLFKSPHVVVSHNTADDPIFNYGNQAALSLFEMTWADFIKLPSRQSAEPMNRDERQRLLDTVEKQNYIDDYSGVRVSATGRRFFIPNAIVWNVTDDSGQFRGQAATFHQWEFLP